MQKRTTDFALISIGAKWKPQFVSLLSKLPAESL
tara:strand:+ start:32 stop:133 length:102 start_codon:yes stop_codon:yes gene_type:complete